MPRCLKCAQGVDRADALCVACEGHVLADATAPGAGAGTSPGVAAPEADVSTQENTAPERRGWAGGWSRSHKVAALATAAGAAVIAVTVVGTGARGARSLPPAVEQASIAGVTPARGLPVPAPAVHSWSKANSARWVSNYARSIAFELPAENTASGWMTRVRPVLVVRCLSNTTDAFVFTQLPAAIEPLDDRRTVQIGFDDDVASAERWPGSPDHNALFAPDGVSLARRIARARTMRFGFTPHNGPPATIEFHVEGFSAHIGSVARLCRWK